MYGAGTSEAHEDGIFVVYRCGSRISSKAPGSAIIESCRVDQLFFVSAYQVVSHDLMDVSRVDQLVQKQYSVNMTLDYTKIYLREH